MKTIKSLTVLAITIIFSFTSVFAATMDHNIISDIMENTQTFEPYSKANEQSKAAAIVNENEVSYPDGVLKQIFNKTFIDCKESNGWGYTLKNTDDGPVSGKAVKLTFAKAGYQAFYLRFDSNFNFNSQMMKSGALEVYVKTNMKFSNVRLMLTNDKNGTFIVNESSLMNVVSMDKLVGDWQKIIIPISSYAKEASYWNVKYSQNEFTPFDFSDVTGVGFACSIPQLDEGNVAELYFDDLMITKGNVKDETLGVTLLDNDDYAKTSQKFKMLDLRNVANMGYKDEVADDEKGGWTDQGPLNDFSSFNLFGVNKIKNIPFDFIDPDTNDGKAVLVLRGQNRLWLPNRAEIEVNDFCAGAYIVHSAAWNSTSAATYKFVYDDNTEGDVNVIFGKHIANWWGASDVELSRTAWEGSNPSSATIASYLFAFGNPHPDKKVTKMVFETPGDASIVLIQGITLTDKGPFLPNLKDTNPDTSKWFAYELPNYKDIVGTPLDCSKFLDAPAGKHGYLKSDGDDLIFDDGTKIEFWGTNTVGPSNFLDKSDIDTIVSSIKTSGINVVRMHHLDSSFYSPNIFGTDPDSAELDSAQMDKLCYFWAKLKENGIYFMPGLLCGRAARKAQGIEDPDNISLGWKIECMFDRHMIELQKKYAHDFFTYVNPYTGTSISNDPAALMFEIHNECNITDYGGLYRINSDYYRKEFYELFNQWLKEKYSTADKLKFAWGQTGKILLLDEENFDDGTITLPEEYRTLNFSDKRKADSFEFLVHISRSYHSEMIDYLKNDLGVKGPITGVNNIIMHDLADIWDNAHYDHVDRHIYWTHPTGYTISSGSKAGGLNSQVSSPSSSIGGYMSSQKILGKPLMISEWNMGELNPYMAENYVLGATMFGYQGWNSTMFDHISGPIPYMNKITGFFDVMGEPLRYGFLPASAVLRNRISKAKKGYFTPYTDEQVFNPITQSISVPANLFVTGKCGIKFTDVINMDFDNDDSLIERAKEPILVSDTQEIIWEPKDMMFKVNSPKAQVISGNPSGKKIDLNDVRFEIDNTIATVTVTSCDDIDISESQDILLTVGARVRNSDMVMSPDGRTVVVGGKSPIILEPVTGKVTIKTNGKYDVYVLTSSGTRGKKVKTQLDENGYTIIPLLQSDKTMHYEISKTGENEKVIDKPVFNDVYGDTFAQDAIKELCEKKIMYPQTNTLFIPDSYITTSDFIGALARKLNISATGDNQFSDVSEYNRNYKEIIAAREAKIILGDGINMEPYEFLTKEKMIAFIERASKVCPEFESDGKYITRAQAAFVINSI